MISVPVLSPAYIMLSCYSICHLEASVPNQGQSCGKTQPFAEQFTKIEKGGARNLLELGKVRIGKLGPFYIHNRPAYPLYGQPESRGRHVLCLHPPLSSM